MEIGVKLDVVAAIVELGFSVARYVLKSDQCLVVRCFLDAVGVLDGTEHESRGVRNGV